MQKKIKVGEILRWHTKFVQKYVVVHIDYQNEEEIKVVVVGLSTGHILGPYWYKKKCFVSEGMMPKLKFNLVYKDKIKE